VLLKLTCAAVEPGGMLSGSCLETAGQMQGVEPRIAWLIVLCCAQHGSAVMVWVVGVVVGQVCAMVQEQSSFPVTVSVLQYLW
jgi:hypothetical protein